MPIGVNTALSTMRPVGNAAVMPSPVIFGIVLDESLRKGDLLGPTLALIKGRG